MGRTGSDIARLLEQSEVDGFEYRDFASAFDLQLEEKLKTMAAPVETPATAPPAPEPPPVAAPQRPVFIRPVIPGAARTETSRRSAQPSRADRPTDRVADRLADRPIDALFHRLATGGGEGADQKLPALFARLR
ncbi:hypothetical protein [Niveispirillum sp. BGYR6]|uniref:hypothetical protein n=1 Tax=Niveispirillum sp. BGYR6 TaxID=2971249 RepID=UPI0022B97178|nr:hypothetical protein [Niveispirillum sp. BGYR6]MDG5497650.1 hypothetical protein [Niveispirillum sp. BGYR6]